MSECPHLADCPGCPRFQAGGISPTARNTLRALAARWGAPPLRVHAGPPIEFRIRARLAVRGRSALPVVGIFREGTHRVVDVPRCVIHHPLVNRAAAALRDAMRITGTSVYSDKSGRGSVRYLQVVVQRSTNTAQVTLVTNDAEPDGVQPLFRALTEALGEELHSLFWNRQLARGNAILGDHFVRISGPEAVEERIAGARIYFPPGAFGQSNLDLAEAIVERIHRMIPDAARVAEYYAGVGAIGLGLAPRCESLMMNEVGAGSLTGLGLGIAALEPEVRERVAVFPGSAAEHAELLERADVVVVDPPRKGLDAALLTRLVQASAGDVVYLSCGLKSFERDGAALHAAGYQVLELHAYDLFPHTEHVETLAHFRR